MYTNNYNFNNPCNQFNSKETYYTPPADSNDAGFDMVEDTYRPESEYKCEEPIAYDEDALDSAVYVTASTIFDNQESRQGRMVLTDKKISQSFTYPEEQSKFLETFKTSAKKEIQGPKLNYLAALKKPKKTPTVSHVEEQPKPLELNTSNKKEIQVPAKPSFLEVLKKNSSTKLPELHGSETLGKKLAEKKIIVNPLVHENAIFGSYCLFDVVSIAQIVLREYGNSCLTYDCFNYETTREISKTVDLAQMLSLNLQTLTKMRTEGEIDYRIHYTNKRNDLTQQYTDTEVAASDNWSKFQRRYTKNIVFFNPYMNNARDTEYLISCLFSYAHSNLDVSGVVTLMWNPQRKDSFGKINIVKVASRHSFMLIEKRSGSDLAEKTGFTHLKNSTSLKTAEDTTKNVVVSKKSTDIIMMFMRILKAKNSPVITPVIPQDNVMANAFMTGLASVN